ncbi:MAG: electron transport complex subunit RsxA [Firmicutes bacterium]|nr:electron transport complex subunit RsxA [Bacillota bacterium]
MNLISLFIASFLTENIVLAKFLGVCPFIGTSNKEKNAFMMGLAVTGVVTISSLLTYCLYYYVLLPTNTGYLKTIVFILVIASMVQIVEIIIRNKFKKIHESLGIYLPLITTNCAVLGTVLLNINNNFTLLETLVFSFGSGAGFTLVIYIFSTIRARLETSNVPKSFRGTPIALITAAIMALIFGRYVGG